MLIKDSKALKNVTFASLSYMDPLIKCQKLDARHVKRNFTLLVFINGSQPAKILLVHSAEIYFENKFSIQNK